MSWTAPRRPKTSLTIPSTITWIGHTVLQGCSGLESVTMTNNDAYSLACGGKILVEKSSGAAKICLGGTTSVTIDSSIKIIGGNCFRWCSKLTDITFHSGVTNIGYSICRDCTALQWIDFCGCTIKKQSDGTAAYLVT